MPQYDIPSRTWDPFRRPSGETEPSSRSASLRSRHLVRPRLLPAFGFVTLALLLGRLELGFFALYLVARETELSRPGGGVGLSTTALWVTGVGMLLSYTRSDSWGSAAEVAVVLFGMGAARVGRRTHPGKMVWVLGLVAFVACLPLGEVVWFLVHGALACLLALLAWTWMRDTPEPPGRTLAKELGGSFDLETQEVRAEEGGVEVVGFLYPHLWCTGPMPSRAAHEDAAVTMRACRCDACRSFDPKDASETVLDVDGHTVTIAHRGLEQLVRSVDQGELRALLRQLAALPHGKVVLVDGEMSVRAGGVPRDVRAAGPRAAASWSSRTGAQVFRLAFALHDYLERSATQTYR